MLFLIGCDEREDGAKNYDEVRISLQELEMFVQVVKDGLIFVEGGEFQMGDFGAKYGPEQLHYDMDQDSKPLHTVRLSNFYAEKFKVTNQQFQFYLQANGLQLRQDLAGTAFEVISQPNNTPAHMDWYEAEQYCAWLKDVSDLPFSLPTEAQWEYAARSRGQFLMVSTDDGTYKATRVPATEDDGPRGINISSAYDRMSFAETMGWRTDSITPLPVDMFPPNPLGMYSMSDNGQEWVKDWYDADYYKYSPIQDPQGPENPVSKDSYGRDLKVARGQGFANPSWGGGVNVHRNPAEPHGYVDASDMVSIRAKTARCVVNSSEPLK
jgi:formylglycine-generating enzyme required for sulfatase activity